VVQTVSRLWVFTFGSLYYDMQQAVVLADTEQQARDILAADMAAQDVATRLCDDCETDHARTFGNGPHGGRPNGERGFTPYYHTAARQQLAERQPTTKGDPVAGQVWSTDQAVVYLIGADG
jgi:hypothetical protein